MKIKTAILAIFAAAVLSGCAAPERWYAYQQNAGNPNAAWSQCQAYARRAVQAIQCPVVCQDRQQTAETVCEPDYLGNVRCTTETRDTVPGIGPRCQEDLGCSMNKNFDMGAANNGTHPEFRSCMSEKGFLPCSQGGLHLPECQ